MIKPEALWSVLTLGIFNTFIAYLLFFAIIEAWGASRASLVTYLMPPVSLILGIVFQNEHVDWKLLVGTALIVGGVAAINLMPNMQKARLPEAAPQSAR
jgi:drug/metabolite transporter (DMT)-like permease